MLDFVTEAQHYPDIQDALRRRLNFQEIYGPFALSVRMMFWAFLTGVLLLTGAYLSAEQHIRHKR